MRLPEFLRSHLNSILVEWDGFARTIWPEFARSDASPSAHSLRDDGEEILRWIAEDMITAQTDVERLDKSRGRGGIEAKDRGSRKHAVARAESGLDLLAMVAEYRALRASVLRLWAESNPTPDRRDLDDITRFNESIDQSLTEAIASFTEHIDGSRKMFMAILAHDLRAPLNAIALSAQSLEELSATDPVWTATAAQIGDSADAMGDLLSDFLEFAAARLGRRLPIKVSAMDLAVLCEDVVRETRAAHATRPVRLKTEGDLTGHWDEGRLRQMLSNLLGNAIHHGSAASPIHVSVCAQNSDIRLAVHNVGPPIPNELLGRIFDPLVRGPGHPSQSRDRPSGLGLGLHIVREIVSAHGGSISVNSANEGTEFAVILPRRLPQA
jgi:signal transduction histidine kinase